VPRTLYRLRSLLELRNASDALLFLRVCGFGCAVPMLMRLPIPRLAAVITRTPRTRSPTATEVERLARLVDLAPRVADPLVRPGCLTRGLTLFWFLRRAGLDVELRFGVDPGGDSGTLEPDASPAPDGHCWLTLNGEPFLEKRDPRPHFAETYRLPLLAA